MCVCGGLQGSSAGLRAFAVVQLLEVVPASGGGKASKGGKAGMSGKGPASGQPATVKVRTWGRNCCGAGSDCRVLRNLKNRPCGFFAFAPVTPMSHENHILAL